MKPIGTHLNHCEEIPIFCLNQMTCEFEAFGCHLEELLFQFNTPIRSEVWNIDHVISCDLINFPRQSSWESPLRIAVRCEEAGDHPPWKRFRGVGERHSQNDRFLLCLSQEVPECRHFHGVCVCNRQSIVGVVFAVAKAVNTEFARISAGHHTHPGWHGDRRDRTLQFSVGTFCHQAMCIGHIVFECVKDKFRCCTIPTDNEDAFFHIFNYKIWSPFILW